eukprot:TRINITY_DN59149_c0_g1_i1.p1 TRINITY_DN59149_c0_g1~~TRINITY_DN59149_c0_g1_i1.p1  ORF type:complete len:148 (+),score=28.93 TRINITY_DN59149_c0_g1_i1:39-482(+)
MNAFLKDLPSRNKDNFSRINPDGHHRSGNGKKSTYITTKDIPSDQVIVTERSNILLRFLHQEWDKKTNATKKRPGALEGQEEPGVGGKRARLDSDPAADPSTPGPSRARSGVSSAGTSGEAGPSFTSILPPPPYDLSSGNRFSQSNN